MEFKFQITRSCESLLELCKWKTKKEDCSSIFQTSMSRNGICCSFNYITHDLIMKQPRYKVILYIVDY